MYGSMSNTVVPSFIGPLFKTLSTLARSQNSTIAASLSRSIFTLCTGPPPCFLVDSKKISNNSSSADVGTFFTKIVAVSVISFLPLGIALGCWAAIDNEHFENVKACIY